VSRSIYLGPWRVDVTIRDGIAAPVPTAALARAMARAAEAAGAPRPASLGLILTDDAELASLNEAHLGKSGPTDVLSFPLLAPESFPAHGGGMARSEPLSRCRLAAGRAWATW
jgi:ssRNA-specific RNase YbeY (16S rRNA maturation enzyme)